MSEHGLGREGLPLGLPPAAPEREQSRAELLKLFDALDEADQGVIALLEKRHAIWVLPDAQRLASEAVLAGLERALDEALARQRDASKALFDAMGGGLDE